jgi:hypothetical protein
MNRDALSQPVGAQNEGAMEALQEALKDHQLPAAYQRLLTSPCGPWYIMAAAILEDVDAQSDAWKRVIWFSRILGASIQTSLQRNKNDAVEEVLSSFTNWLRSSSQAAGIQDIVLTTADYVCERLREQVAVDLDRADCAKELSIFPEIAEVDVAEAEVAELEIPEVEMTEVVMDDEVTIQPETVSSLLEREQTDDPATQEIADHTLSQENDDNSLQQIPITKEEGSNNMETSTMAETTGIRENVSELAVAEKDMTFGNQAVTARTSTSLIPIGLWLGFHNQDMPTMAKLTIYDPANERYMFANEQGHLICQFSKLELLDMVKKDLVNIVDFRKITIK